MNAKLINQLADVWSAIYDDGTTFTDYLGSVVLYHRGIVLRTDEHDNWVLWVDVLARGKFPAKGAHAVIEAARMLKTRELRALANSLTVEQLLEFYGFRNGGKWWTLKLLPLSLHLSDCGYGKIAQLTPVPQKSAMPESHPLAVFRQSGD